MSDPILVNLVRAAEFADRDGKHLARIPIAVHMGGILIMGDLIPARAFAEAGQELVKCIYEATERAVEDLVFAADTTLDVLEDRLPQFIHLKNVTFCIPGGEEIPSNSTEHWRGRIDRIDGFVLGEVL